MKMHYFIWLCTGVGFLFVGALFRGSVDIITSKAYADGQASILNKIPAKDMPVKDITIEALSNVKVGKI